MLWVYKRPKLGDCSIYVIEHVAVYSNHKLGDSCKARKILLIIW